MRFSISTLNICLIHSTKQIVIVQALLGVYLGKVKANARGRNSNIIMLATLVPESHIFSNVESASLIY